MHKRTKQRVNPYIYWVYLPFDNSFFFRHKQVSSRNVYIFGSHMYKMGRRTFPFTKNKLHIINDIKHFKKSTCTGIKSWLSFKREKIYVKEHKKVYLS